MSRAPADPQPGSPSSEPNQSALGQVMALGLVVGLLAVAVVLVDGWFGLPGAAARMLFLGLALPLLFVGGGAARRAGTAAAAAATSWISPRARGGALLVLALVTFLHGFGDDLWRYLTTPTVRVWNVFHYYLGAEYFAELGYDDLYTAALYADAEGNDYWDPIDEVRNLATYAVEPRVLAELAYDPERHFTADRWQRFHRDVAALEIHRAPAGWVDIFRDRGYNPTPFWTAVAHPLTHALPASRLAALKALTSLDLWLYLGTFLLLARVFGLVPAATSLFFFAVTPVNVNRLIGGFLQYDWFCAVAIGVAGVARRRPAVAALGLGYAALARVFPLALAGAVLLPDLARLWRQRGQLATAWRAPRHRFARRYANWLAVMLVAGFAWGCTTPRGFGAWQDFAERIRRHSAAHVTGEQRVGLQHAFTAPIAGDGAEEGGNRRDTLDRQRGLYRVVALLLVGGFVLVVGRRRRTEAALLALVVVFALAVASRYYWALLALLPLVARGGVDGRRRGRLLDVGQLLVYLGFGVTYLTWGERYEAYVAFNGLLALLFATWLASWWWRDRAVRQRARRRLSAIARPA